MLCGTRSRTFRIGDDPMASRASRQPNEVPTASGKGQELSSTVTYTANEHAVVLVETGYEAKETGIRGTRPGTSVIGYHGRPATGPVRGRVLLLPSCSQHIVGLETGIK